MTFAERLRGKDGCYRHVQLIMAAIDQYAEAATGNRDYFLNKPLSIGGSRPARCSMAASTLS
jgi:hypothetical protein